MNDFIYIYITNPDKETARKIARHLVSRKLIACANIYPGVSSIYSWKGKIVEQKEIILIAKTLEKKYGEVKREVEKLHPYDVPCIVKIPVSGNREYFEWVRGEVR